MRQINCYIPLRIRIVGQPSDQQLRDLAVCIEKTIARRLEFAQQTIGHAARHSAATREILREAYASPKYDQANAAYSVPSYDSGGTPTPLRVRSSADQVRRGQQSQIQSQMQDALRRIDKLLSTGVFDWWVTDIEARTALRILEGLRPLALLGTVQAMRLNGLWRTLLQQLPESDFEALTTLQQKIDRAYGYVTPGDRLMVEIGVPGGAVRTLRLEVDVNDDGIVLPQLPSSLQVAEMLPRDIPDKISRAYIDALIYVNPIIRVRVSYRSSLYSPFNGPVPGELWFNSNWIRDDSPEGRRRAKRGEFVSYVAAVPATTAATQAALGNYLEWIDRNYNSQEFLVRTPPELWGWALKQAYRRIPQSPLRRFLDLAQSLRGVARVASKDEKARMDDALERYMAWVGAHTDDPRLAEIDPIEVWARAYRRSLDAWAQEFEKQELAKLREPKPADLEAAGRKLDEALEFLKLHVWKLRPPEVIESPSMGIGHIIWESEEEQRVRSEIGSGYLSAVVSRMLDPAFASVSIKDDFRNWLVDQNPELYARYLFAESHPDVERYAVEIDRPAWQTAVETAVAFIPIIGHIVAAGELIAGKDMFGNDLSTVEQAILAASLLLPVAAKVVKGVSALRLAKLYNLTEKETSALLRVTWGIRPGTTAARLLGDAGADIRAGRRITDGKQIKQLEKVLKDIHLTDPGLASSLREERAAAEAGAGGAPAAATADTDAAIKQLDASGVLQSEVPERLDPDTVERWISDELPAGPSEGAKPLEVWAPGPPPPPPVKTFREALDAVDISAIPPEDLDRLKTGWRRYVNKAGSRRLTNEEDYIRFIYGKATKQLPAVTSVARELGAPGAIEQMAGHEFERFVDAKLPPGSSNAAAYPAGFPEGVAPDHLPPGRTKVFLNPDGTVSKTGRGTPFSAEFVGDSKYRGAIPTSDQTRGFVRLAQFSDTKKLVFFVRWQESFSPAGLLRDTNNVGYVLPPSLKDAIVGSGIRQEATRLGVSIEVVSDPLWK